MKQKNKISKINTQENKSGNFVIQGKSKKNINKALSPQIDLKFQSFGSNFSKKQKQFIRKYLGEEATNIRFYVIRHGDTGIKGLSPAEAPLKSGEKAKFDDISNLLKEVGINIENSYLLYDKGTVRVVETADFINKKIKLSSDRIQEDVIGLDSTNKSDISKTGREINIAKKTADFIRELFLLSKTIKNVNILSVIHRANISVIEEMFERNEKKCLKFDHKDIVTGGIKEFDISSKGKSINFNEDMNILFLNIRNIGSIIKSFKGDKKLKKVIQQFQSKKLQIWELQNYINAYFRSKTKLYKHYLFSENDDLRIFCIANLFKNGKFKIIKDKLIELVKKEDDKNMLNFVETLLFICEDDSQKKEIIEMLVNSQNMPVITALDKLNFFANYEEFVKPNIRFMRQKTLDKKLAEGENVIIPISFQNNKYSSIESLVKSGNRITIEGEAGSGKSTKLLEIMEYLSPNEEEGIKYLPIYISLANISLVELKSEIKRLKGTLSSKSDTEFVYLFDALDESRWDEAQKKKFLSEINELQGTVILTSRPGNIPLYKEKEKKTKFKTLKLECLTSEQINTYINMYLTLEQQKIWEELKKKSFIENIKSNPLILSIICNLIISNKSLLGLDTVADLYDKITNKRLLDWELKKGTRIIEEGVMKYRKYLLGEIAYMTREREPTEEEELNTKFIIDTIRDGITEHSISDLINERLYLYEGRIPASKIDNKLQYDLECLNLLNKGEEGEICFIHETFREYFFFLNCISKFEEGFFDDINNKELFFDIVENINEIGGKEWLKVLDKIIDTGGYVFHKGIVNAIGRIKDKDGLKILRRIYYIEKTKSSEPDFLFIINAIGKIGNHKGLDLIDDILDYFITEEKKGKSISFCINSLLEVLLSIKKNNGKKIVILNKITKLSNFREIDYVGILDTFVTCVNSVGIKSFFSDINFVLRNNILKIRNNYPSANKNEDILVLYIKIYKIFGNIEILEDIYKYVLKIDYKRMHGERGLLSADKLTKILNFLSETLVLYPKNGIFKKIRDKIESEINKLIYFPCEDKNIVGVFDVLYQLKGANVIEDVEKYLSFIEKESENNESYYLSHSEDISKEICELLLKIKPKNELEVIAKICKLDNAFVKYKSAHTLIDTLGAIGTPESIHFLVFLFDDYDRFNELEEDKTLAEKVYNFIVDLGGEKYTEYLDEIGELFL